MPSTSSPQTSSATVPWPSASRGWWAVIVLTLAYIVSFVDRTILSLLTEPIKADLGINDTQLSLLQGAAFGLFYCAAGLPLGWLVDKISRRRVIVAGITVWCLATAACGLAQNFWHLFAARMGVGAGEASLSPGAVSMISDNFPPERRALPLGFYSSAAAVGSGLALVLGGAVIALIERSPQIHLPLVGAVANWQAVFVIVGLLGLSVAALMFTVKEPERRANPTAPTATAPASGSTLIGTLKANPGFYICFIGGFALITCLTYAVISWAPAAFIRTYGWTPQDVGARYGLVQLICGALGAVFGGWLAGYLRRRGLAAADILVSGVAMTLTALLTAFAIMAPTGEQATLRFIPALFCFLIPAGLSLSALQEVIPPDLRGRMAALYFFVIGVTGLAVGPVSVGLLTDYVFADPLRLPEAIAIVSLIFGLSAGALVLTSVRFWRRMTQGA